MTGMDESRAGERAGAWIGAWLRASLRRCGELRRRSGWRAIGLALLVALAPPGTGAVSIGGPFELVDQHGATRTDRDFRGAYMLMYFGFTYCPDTCPTTLLKVTNALEDLAAVAPAKAERVVPVFISVDPERDTPEALRSYAENFHPRLVALTGTPRELQRLGRAYGVFFAKVPTGEPGEYLMDHTGFVYLIRPDGKYVEHFESDASVGDLVDALQRHVLVAKVGS
jgi:cytochrome oxidase Cu insertion factor (SCO1/SenC/PrrC family)